MALTLVNAPAADAVSLADVKAQLRIDHATEDAALLKATRAAAAYLTGRDGWSGLALITQEWDLTLDEFPCGYGRREPWPRNVAIRVPLKPLQSVTSLKYVDTAGAPQTLDPVKYVVHPSEEPGLIVPAYGEVWPSTRCQIGAVTARVKVGYGAGAASIPDPVRHALLILVGHFYEHRDDDAPVPVVIDALLANHRLWGAA